MPLSLDKLLDRQLSFMNQYFEVIAVSSDDNGYLNRIKEKENVEVFSVEMTRKISPFKDLIALFKLCKLFIKIKPTIVHSHTPKAGILGMLAARLTNVPIRLHTVAGLPLMEVTGTKRKVLNFVEKVTYACANKVYPNSKGLMDFIIANKFCKTSKLAIIANGSTNGVDTKKFSLENAVIEQSNHIINELGIKADDFVFIYVGRIVSDKGINELVKAFQEISELHINVKLLLVGPLENELDPLDFITTITIEQNPHIFSVGFKQDVRPYFALSNCLVFPSYREGFPNVVMQAGAMGLPSIVTDINGCNEIIENGKNGLIIPVKDVETLKVAMEQMINQYEMYQQLKQNARHMIQSRYEQHVVWKALLEEYQSLISHLKS